MLIASDFSAITDCRSMQGRFEAADNITPSRRDRDAIDPDSFYFTLMLATKSFLVLALNK